MVRGEGDVHGWVYERAEGEWDGEAFGDVVLGAGDW